MYAKISNGAVVEWPLSNIKKLFPNTSFPSPLTAETMPEGYVIVGVIPPPQVDATQQAVPGQPIYQNNEWVQSWAVVERDITDVRAMLISRANEIRNTRMDGGITLNGLPISTDKGTKAELLGATKKPNPNRRRRVGGQTILLTAAILTAMEDAVTAHTDATDGYHCDLCDSIEAADLATLALIDVNAGWPSTDY